MLETDQKMSAEIAKAEKAAFKAPTEAHWYLPTGEPFHKVPYKDKKRAGELRDAKLGDAREVLAARSVTQMQKLIAKPQLEVWGKNQLLDAIRTIGAQWMPLNPADMEKWIEEVIREAGRTREEAAERGDRLHEALLLAAQGKTIPERFSKHVEAVQKALAKHKIDLTHGKAETSFNSPEGYGGTVDWFEMGSEREDGNPKMLDYKTRELLDPKVKLAYPEKAQQLVAYRRALALPDADCYNVFVDLEANVCIHHWEEPILRHEEKKFLILLHYSHVNDKYSPTRDGTTQLWSKHND